MIKLFVVMNLFFFSVELTGWILVTTASSFPFILIGRVFNGVGCGLSLPAAYIMLTDISLIRYTYKGASRILLNTEFHFSEPMDQFGALFLPVDIFHSPLFPFFRSFYLILEFSITHSLQIQVCINNIRQNQLFLQ